MTDDPQSRPAVWALPASALRLAVRGGRCPICRAPGLGRHWHSRCCLTRCQMRSGGFSSKASAADLPVGTWSETDGPQVASGHGCQVGVLANPNTEGGLMCQCPAVTGFSACETWFIPEALRSTASWRTVLGPSPGRGLWALSQAVHCCPQAGTASGGSSWRAGWAC